MKFLFRPDQDRWHKQDSWKKSAYAFVPYQTNFGELCGFAEDVVAGGKGFGLHPHQNMEISTVMLAGTQTHTDTTGGKGLLGENKVQTMSAGTGLQHSEYNASDSEPFHSFQIWVYPKTLNVPPRHETFSYQPEEKLNRILLALSPDRRNGSALINQDAFLSVCRLQKEQAVTYAMHTPTNGVYLHCAQGAVAVEGYELKAGDALGIYETGFVKLTATDDADLVFVEVPMTRGVTVQH